MTQKLKPRRGWKPPELDAEGNIVKNQEPQETDVLENTAPLTPEEQAIAARVAGDSSREWDVITERDLLDYSFGKDVFALPAPAKKQQDEKKFVFRWIERTPRRPDEIRSKDAPFKWWVCNSTNTPFLRDNFDPILGCVCREDQMLMFQPYWMKVKRDEILRRQNEGVKDVRSKDGETKGDGMSFVAGREITSGDRVVFDESGGDMSDIVAEGDEGSP
ncbi:MAG: hypothetical protein V2B18_25580 [Pseudomonadota bacterium]